MSRPPHAPPISPSPLIGTWGPTPGPIVAMAATDDALFLAEVPASGQPMRVHVGQWRDGQWRWQTPWSVPRPPTVAPGHDLTGTGAWLGVHAESGGTRVVLTRVEYQGGSHGVALTTLANGAWATTEEIESPTDSDIAFGIPALRRGDTLVTIEQEDRLWHYDRSSRGTWQGRTLSTPPGASLVCPPPMDLDTNGDELALAYHDESERPMLALYRRDVARRYTLASTHPLPGPVNVLRYRGGALHVGFASPVADGAIAWALAPGRTGPLVPTRRFEVPAPEQARTEHLTELDVADRSILALQLDAAWVLDAAAASPTRRLELPPTGDGKPRRPTGVLVGSIAVVLLADRLGVFALA